MLGNVIVVAVSAWSKPTLSVPDTLINFGLRPCVMEISLSAVLPFFPSDPFELALARYHEQLSGGQEMTALRTAADSNGTSSNSPSHAGAGGNAATGYESKYASPSSSPARRAAAAAAGAAGRGSRAPVSPELKRISVPDNEFPAWSVLDCLSDDDDAWVHTDDEAETEAEEVGGGIRREQKQAGAQAAGSVYRGGAAGGKRQATVHDGSTGVDDDDDDFSSVISSDYTDDDVQEHHHNHQQGLQSKPVLGGI